MNVSLTHLASAATLGLVLTAVPVRARAQREARENLNSWFSWFGDIELSEKWSIDFDASARRSEGVNETAQYLWRASIRRNVLPNLRVGIGYAGSDTHPYGKLPIAFRAPEHRLFQNIQFTHPMARVQMTHRYRFEQRWSGRVALVDGEERVQNWVRTNRGRYLVRATIPLQGATLDPKEWYVNAGNELFMNWGANIQNNVFDQNRVQVTIGKRFTGNARLEGGYMEQLTLRSNGRQLERNHTITSFITTSFPRRKQ